MVINNQEKFEITVISNIKMLICLVAKEMEISGKYDYTEILDRVNLLQKEYLEEIKNYLDSI